MIIPNQPAPLGQPGQPENAKLLTELQSEVSVEAAPLLQFIVKHVAVIVLVLVLFVIALVGTAGYNWYAERARVQAQKELVRVVMSSQGAEKVKALEAFIAGAPDSIKTAAQLALADAAIVQQDYAVAAKAYAGVAAADSTGALGLLASLNQAQALLSAGKPKEALPLLEKLENVMPESQRNLVRQVLAEAAIQAGDTVKAQKVFEAMANASTGPEADFFRFRAQSLQVAAKPKSE